MGGKPSDSDAEVPTTDSRWRTLPSRDGRRDARAVVVALLVAAGLLVSVTVLPGGAVAQASFTASDVSVTSNAGMVTSLTVAPSGEITYNGLEQPPDETTVVVEVRVADGAWEQVGSKTLAVSTQEGSKSYDFSTIDVLAATSATPGDFRPSDGSQKQVDMDVRLQVTLAGAGPGGNDVTTTVSDTSTVTVTNEQAQAGASGSANTNAS